jgi:hypothetical protein
LFCSGAEDRFRKGVRSQGAKQRGSAPQQPSPIHPHRTPCFRGDNPNPEILNPQPSTLNPQPSTLNPVESTLTERRIWEVLDPHASPRYGQVFTTCLLYIC